MNVHEYEIGLPKQELDTPALLIDLPAMEGNLQRMADFMKGQDVDLRPHAKLYKATPVLAHMQLEAGAIGITCAKLAEAEVLAASGIKDILVANQIVGARKIRRLVNLATYSDVMVAVDGHANVAELSQAATAKGVQLRVVVEVNIGHDRCGVEPFEPVLELAQAVEAAPGLYFSGLMGYDGHCTMKVSEEERGPLSRQANTLLVETRRYLEEAGLEVEIVSGGGTFTYQYAGTVEGMTEIQAGTYLLMDTAFKENGVSDFDCALTVLGTVTSRPTWSGAEDLAIIDVGSKAIDTCWGLPQMKEPAGATAFSLSQEHGRVRVEGPAQNLKVADKVELWVHNANGTVNLYDRFYGIREGIVETVWEIGARGRAT